MADTSTMITTIDLFAGAGGLTAGMHSGSMRFQPLVAVESDTKAAASYMANHPDTTVHAGLIEDWIQGGAIPDADVIVGGPPCQGFSALGKQDADDLRNSLWERYAEVIIAARPKYFVVENVSQFLNSDQFREFEKRTQVAGVLGDYDISARWVLNSAQYGAPQKRQRTVIIGRHRDLPEVEKPTMSHEEVNSWLTVADAWVGLPDAVTETDLPERRTPEGLRGPYKTSELHLTRHFAELSLARFKDIPYGGNRFDIAPERLADCWKSHKTGSGDVMGRMFWDRPSVTIRTEFTKPEKGRYLHPTQHRAITLQEGARLQGFDDDYLWCGSKTDIARQIGNAVPIQLGAAIGRTIASLI